MGKKVEKPKENLAPAYFVQYSALWCVLLGFFVMLLSLGNSQMGPGTEGMGEVRDAFGTNGGAGLLAFAKNVIFGRNDGSSKTFRIRQGTSDRVSGIDGYIRGLLKKQGLGDISNTVLVETEDGMKVQIKVPVSFEGNQRMEKDSNEFIERLASMFVGMRDFNIEVMAVCAADEAEADQEECQRSAMLRAALVARRLMEKSGMSPDRVRAVGYSDTRFIVRYGMEPVNECVLISIGQETW
ncbi:MAG: hypothetical protein JXR40_00980 [Pontiellaceae bacterium]|nr:hypothetical protein [Pontiellaceae bacterium]